MGKLLGIAFIIGGMAGYLYSWQGKQRVCRDRVTDFITFLQKCVFIMGTENKKISHLLREYRGMTCELNVTLSEIARRLELNIYPQGQSIWEEVFREKEQNWDVDKETFELMIHAGNGFFGRNRGENICFLQKSIRELEEQEKKNRERDTKERKVWIPVGMLSGMMLVILLV